MTQGALGLETLFTDVEGPKASLGDHLLLIRSHTDIMRTVFAFHVQAVDCLSPLGRICRIVASDLVLAAIKVEGRSTTSETKHQVQRVIVTDFIIR